MSVDKNIDYKLTLKDLFTSKMKEAANSTKQMDSNMSGLGTKLASIGASIGITALGRQMVMTGAQFDSYKARLETMLGSQRMAAKAFEDIKADAAKTPFDVGSLTQANAMLISAGADAGEARKMVLGLGNAIAATGGGSDELNRMAVNLQQIKTLGKASAMDVKQFAFAGIPIYQLLAKTTGKTVEEVKKMDVTYEQLAMAFDKAAEKGGMFYQGLEKQSKAIGGQLSNLGDQATNTLIEFYEMLKPAITKVISLLSKMLTWVSKNKETVLLIGKIAGVVGLAVGAFKLWSMVTSFQLVPAILSMNVAMAANPIGAVIVAVSALVAVLATLISEYKTVAQLHQEKMNKDIGDAFNEEAKQVEFLTEKYQKLGYSKDKASKLGLEAAKRNLKGDLADAKSKLENAKTEEERLLAERTIAKLGGRGQYLKEMSEKTLGGVVSKKGGEASSGTTAGSGSSGATAMSSTDLSAARPQSLIININDGLVKQLNVYSQNLAESAAKIREEVAKALLEVANDANLAAR